MNDDAQPLPLNVDFEFEAYIVALKKLKMTPKRIADQHPEKVFRAQYRKELTKRGFSDDTVKQLSAKMK